MARFKIARGKLMVLAPGQEPEQKIVHLVWDSTNQAFGIQVLDGQLQGHVFFVSQAALRETRDKGTDADKLKSV